MSATGAYREDDLNINTQNPIMFRAWIYRQRLNKVTKYVFVRKSVLYLADLGWRGRPPGSLLLLNQGSEAFLVRHCVTLLTNTPFLTVWCGTRKWCQEYHKLIALVPASLGSLLELGQGQVWTAWAWGHREGLTSKTGHVGPRSAPWCPRNTTNGRDSISILLGLSLLNILTRSLNRKKPGN